MSITGASLCLAVVTKYHRPAMHAKSCSYMYTCCGPPCTLSRVVKSSQLLASLLWTIFSEGLQRFSYLNNLYSTVVLREWLAYQDSYTCKITLAISILLLQYVSCLGSRRFRTQTSLHYLSVHRSFLEVNWVCSLLYLSASWCNLNTVYRLL